MEMKRRDFAKTLGLAAMCFAIGKANVATPQSGPQVAITMDDFSWANPVKLSAAERNAAILGALKGHSVKAAAFVIGRNADSETGRTLLREWNNAGHLICNHTYSHRNYNAESMTTGAYAEDILKAEKVLQDFTRYRKLFRFPMLKEGNTALKRDGLRKFLKQHSYRTGHVTIDNSDWIVDERLRARLVKDPQADVSPYRDYYLKHMWDRAVYYDDLARKVTGRNVKHTILTHFNLLNGLFLADLMEMFKQKGWQLIDAEEAFTDPVFQAEPKVLPAGESIVWSLAKESGKIDKDLRYPAEDGEIERAAMDKLGL
ncbi:MAG TPA: polysaccharide deacetylase family protein [Pyrinomonadaceae bacterium]|nr:polysaccharide deacetylase family protein [Pyrinomonadaceae bacterium]